MEVPAYGIKEQIASGDPLDRAVESLGLLGYAVVESGYADAELVHFSEQFDAVYARWQASQGGIQALEDIDEHYTIRAPLAISDAFVTLATNPNILKVGERLLGNHFILNQQNGIINPPNGIRYNQGAYHRDLPYQHFVTSRPLAINALFCLDDFTHENGATYVIPGAHKQEAFSSHEAICEMEKQITAPKGSFIILDCMLFHRGGKNRTRVARRGVNHVYSLPFIKQQIELPSLLGERFHDPALKRLLDYGNTPPRDVKDYLSRRRSRTLEK